MIADWRSGGRAGLSYMNPTTVSHDDWGSQTSSFVSPAMFVEFSCRYKKIYGYYKATA